jgi:tetratricopeptide (TPR) repeat protein
MLQGRIAFAAGNLAAGADPVAAAAAADPRLAAAQALQGDLARRLRQDPAAARAAYQAALATSRLHPRATYGLGKLALSGKIPIGEAREPLQRLLADAPATPAPERARAALYLAALDLRAGDRAAARADLDAVKDPGSRAWADLAAATLAVERGTYHAVTGAPPAYQSAADDDPPDLAPAPPAPPPAPAPLLAAPKPAPSKKAVKKSAVTAPGKKATPPAKKAAGTVRRHPRSAR